MAAFVSRERASHAAQWLKIAADPTVVARTIVVGEGAEGGAEAVAGHIVSWEHDGVREIGYWIGREFWGRGVATVALRDYLGVVVGRPLYAWVALANARSVRVLEKNGFVFDHLDEVFRVFRLD
jgi:RimJ/RimL family protein N-acetyltransferase